MDLLHDYILYVYEYELTLGGTFSRERFFVNDNYVKYDARSTGNLPSLTS